MSLSTFVRRMFRRAAQPRNTGLRHNANRFRPQLDGLESREVPANISTTTLSPAIEGSPFGTVGYVRVSTDTPSSLPIMVNLGYSGSASNGTDYSASTSATIPAYASYVDVAITPYNNFTATGTQTVITTILSDWFNTYNVGTPSTSTTNVFDDDTPQVTVAKQGSDPTEGGNGTFRITRTGSTGSNLTVNYSVGGSATSGTDYTSIGTSATITSGNSYVDVTVTTLVDNVVEAGGETVVMTITDGGSSYTALPTATDTITITDDPPVISLTVVNTKEGEDPGYVRFTRSGGKLADALVVSYSVGGTATNGTDYTTISTSVTIGAGNTYADVEVDPTTDLLGEVDETVTMTVSTGSSYTLSGGTSTSMATLVIEDDPDTATTLIHGEDFELTDPGTSQSVNVTLTVTYNASGSPGLYTWEYVVESPSGNTDNWTTFLIPVEDMDSDVGGVVSPSGWTGSVGGSDVSWSATGSGLAPGNSATFKFTTDPRGIGPDTMEISAAGGTVVADLPTAPAPRPVMTQVPRAVLAFEGPAQGLQKYSLRVEITTASGGSSNSGALAVNVNGTNDARELIFTALQYGGWSVVRLGNNSIDIRGLSEYPGLDGLKTIKITITNLDPASTAPEITPYGGVTIAP